jgi:4-alpha-glucanotransferase
MLKTRASGILLHITSLPGEYGIGDLGPQAYKFVDFLVSAGQKCWQILPINPVTSEGFYSPYNCSSAFAGNPLLISPEILYQEGLLTKEEIQVSGTFPDGEVDYHRVEEVKQLLFKPTFERFAQSDKFRQGYEEFKVQNNFWLNDFATFISLQKLYKNSSWHSWPTNIRDRQEKDLKEIKTQLQHEVDEQSFLQYIFFRQWTDIKNYCARQGVKIIGDIPIYVSYDSADVWTSPRNFKLNQEKKPEFIAGVPPDYFSKTGQLWENPVYNWQEMKKNNYQWFMERIGHNLKLFDIVRIDHFRGLIAYWQVPAGDKTAKNGSWIDGPREDFLKVLFERFPSAPIIAENLGHITADVQDVIKKYSLASMKVLQFAFDGDPAKNPHIPFNHVENSIVYTGTHDNNTIIEWFKSEAGSEQKKRIKKYLGHNVSPESVNWDFIRMAMDSVAKLAIFPAQDILGLAGTARMNRPSSMKGNWLWRLKPGQLSPDLAEKLGRLAKTCNRI